MLHLLIKKYLAYWILCSSIQIVKAYAAEKEEKIKYKAAQNDVFFWGSINQIIMYHDAFVKTNVNSFLTRYIKEFTLETRIGIFLYLFRNTRYLTPRQRFFLATLTPTQILSRKFLQTNFHLSEICWFYKTYNIHIVNTISTSKLPSNIFHL